MQKVVLGQIVAPHGVRGDLRIMPLTSNTQLFMDMDYLLLPDERRLQIVKARPHKNIMLVTVKEVTSIEEAEMLRGRRRGRTDRRIQGRAANRQQGCVCDPAPGRQGHPGG